ncbi:hypothetical protein CPB86DRAFT_787262 [Serendipita vermifera]|nr:hypothetical protein CPB86DRAFT_787262 [Serendipita vermifera]
MQVNNSLPVELITKIIVIALGQKHDGHTIGYNAAWSMPPSNNLGAYVSRYSNLSQSTVNALPLSSGVTDDKVIEMADPEKPIGFYAMAKVLRLVNRTFAAIVTPLLYEEMNLLLHTEDVANLNAAVEHGILPYAHHIRSLYMYADPKFSGISDELEEYSARVLNECIKLTSLGLYFQAAGLRDTSDWARLRQVIVTLAEEGELSSIGFYSEHVLTGRFYISYHLFLDGLIDSLSQSERARSRIKHLDFAVFLIPGPVHNKIRASFPNLESLTMRLSFRGPPGGWGDRDAEGMWFQLKNLTRLQFYCCEGAYAPDVPEIVSFFPALRELLISRCDAEVHEATGPHEEG